MTDGDYAGSVSFLLSQVGAHAARRFAEELAHRGLSPRAFAVMSNLLQLGPRTQQQLADELAMHRNNVVGLVDDLDAAGWVRRAPNPADRRSYSLQLTADGRRVIRSALRVVPQMDEELTAGLDPSQAAALSTVLREVAGAAGLTAGVHPHLSRRRTP